MPDSQKISSEIRDELRKIQSLSADKRFELVEQYADAENIELLKYVLSMDIDATPSNRQALLIKIFKRHSMDVFDTLIASRQMTDGTDKAYLMCYALKFCKNVRTVEAMYENGFYLTEEYLNNDQTSLNVRVLQKIGKIGNLDVLKVFEKYQPEMFNAPYLHRIIEGATAQKENSDNLSYLLDRYIEDVDYDVLMEVAVKENSVTAFKTLLNKRTDAYEAELELFGDIADSREEKKLLHAMADFNSASNRGLTDPMKIIKLAYQYKAMDLLFFMVSTQDLSGIDLNEVMNLCASYSMDSEYAPKAIETLLEQGVKADFDKGAALFTAARTNFKVLKIFEKYGFDRNEYADLIFSGAAKGHDVETFDYVLDNYAECDFDRQKILDDVIGTKHTTLIEHVIASKHFETDAYITEYCIKSAIANNDPSFVNELIERLETPVITEKALDTLLDAKHDSKGFDIFSHFLEEGMSLSGYEQKAAMLVMFSIYHSIHDTAEQLMKNEGVVQCLDKGRVLAVSLWAYNENAIDLLLSRDDTPARSFDWKAYFSMAGGDFESLKLSPKRMKLLNKVYRKLVRERQQAERDVSAMNIDGLLQAPKSAWLKAETGQDAPLLKLAKTRNLMPVLKTYQARTGVRFTAEDILQTKGANGSVLDAVVSYHHTLDFFDPKYWVKDIDAMKKLFSALPEYLQNEKGEQIFTETKLSAIRKSRSAPKIKRRR